MRIKGSLARGVLLALGLALFPTTAFAAETVIPSSACKVLNKKVVSQDKTYTCTKSGKKLIWNKGVVVTKPTLTSTSTPADTPAVSPTNTTATTSTLEAEATGPTCSRNKNALRNC